MLTINEAVERARVQFEKLLEERRDRMALRMIADGMDPNQTAPIDPPEAGAWSRTTFNQILERQTAADQAWLDEQLVSIRASLLDKRGWE